MAGLDRQNIVLINWTILQLSLSCIRFTFGQSESHNNVLPENVYFTSERGQLRAQYGVEAVDSETFFRTKRSTRWVNPYDNPEQGRNSRQVRTLSHNPLYTRDVAPPSAEYQASLTRPLMSAKGEDKAHLLRPEKCIPIEIPLCKNIGYNLTYMPNAFHHETQEEAGLEVHQFFPLVTINCSEDLRLFLCSLYTPICLPNWPYRLTACRSLCESARDGCMPLMGSHGFQWPERMKCDLLPEGSECVSRRKPTAKSDQTQSTDEKNVLDSIGKSHSRSKQYQQQLVYNTTSTVARELARVYLDQLTAKKTKMTHERHINNKVSRGKLKEILENMIIEQEEGKSICLPCRCRDPYVSAYKPPYNEVVTGNVRGCLPSCHNPAFNSKSDQTFTTFWLGLWSVLCILSTLATVTTFLADPDRFQYPERPIIYLSACYLMIALGYLTRVGMGHDAIACDGAVLRRGSTGPAQCSIVFLLTYVFGMASSVWWVILTVTWFLAAGLKWGSEAIANYSQLYHFLAWFFPGLQAILILILSAIDGDPVGGLCYVGSTNLTYLRVFVLAPMCIYLGLGTIFLLAGFVALFKIRSVIKLQSRGHLKTDKLEKLMIRIGIFGVLYTVPATVVISCIWYEVWNREDWNQAHNCPCLPISSFNSDWIEQVIHKVTIILQNMNEPQTQDIQHLTSSEILQSTLQPNSMITPSNQPEHAVFMLKYFMSLVVGITSGFWIWSSKTLDSWRSCFSRITNRKKSPSIQNSKFTPFNTNLNTTTHFPAIPGAQTPANYASPWTAGRTSLWNAKNMGAGSSCTTWPDEFGPTTRLLPQPPASSFSMNCNHVSGAATHLGASIPTAVGSLFTNGSRPPTTGGHTDANILNCGVPMEGTGNLHLMPSTPMTHI